VAANTGSLLVIDRLDPIYADFTITEDDLTAVQRNMREGTLKVEVRLPDEPNMPKQGELTFLDNAVQEGTGTVKLRSTIPNGDHFFWPGRFVKVRLILKTLSNAVLVPAAAPQMSANGPFVYVIKEDSTAELRPVKLGQRQGDLIVVADGLQKGERVVTTGQLAVMPGAKVHVDEPRSVTSPEPAGKENKS
jgi:multidrug efflux system membrane fusion protein